MKMRVYAVLDKAVEAYLNPLFFRSKGEAHRSFVDAIAQEGSQFARHKSDYAFCFLGFYDDNLGRFESTSPVVELDGATALGALSAVDLSDADADTINSIRQ
ncbi:MAG: nonstructural protein [Microvirus sp.]|nr:MAG: nonstructural protein [Microvirus sp.]